jgi:hypothetical protein
MNKKGWHISIIGLVCLGAVLVSCGSNQGKDPPVHHLLSVTRISELAVNHFPPFEKTVDDAASVTRLYTAIKALPHPAKGIYGCPADDGLRYQLVFALPGAAVQHITVPASGCRFLTLNKSDVRMTNDPFWSLLAQTLGSSETELFPRPSSS